VIKRVFILSFFIAIAGFSISFNPSHLESLSQKFFLEGQEVKGYWVYAEKRGDKYQVIGAKDEGDFCVDDVARVVLFYSEAYEKTGRRNTSILQKKLRGLFLECKHLMVCFTTLLTWMER